MEPVNSQTEWLGPENWSVQFDIPIAKRRRLSLTPLIDVIFLLLLFFMLSSTFTRHTEVELKGGGASSGSVQPDVVVMVRQNGVRVNGEFVEVSEVANRLASLSEAGAKSVVIAITKEISSQEFVDILHQASKSQLSVSIARLDQ